MNQLVPIQTDHAEARGDKFLALARAVASGDVEGLPASDYPLHDAEEYIEAAKDGLEAGDLSELNSMIAMERATQAFRDWQGRGRNWKDAERLEFTDFDEWVGTSNIEKTWGEPDYFTTPRVVPGEGL